MSKFKIDKEMINEIKLNDKIVKDIISCSRFRSKGNINGSDRKVYIFNGIILWSYEEYLKVVYDYIGELYGITDNGVIKGLIHKVIYPDKK